MRKTHAKGGAGQTVARYIDGVMPKIARNRALKVERSPKPLSSATASTGSFEVASRRAARPIRTRNTYWYGVMPTRRRNTRRKPLRQESSNSSLAVA